MGNQGPVGNKGPIGDQGPAGLPGLDVSDATIGDKAFSNPPSDLTVAERADVQAAIATGRLQKSVAGNSDVTLTDAEAAYDSIEFTGALTGDVIATLPVRPSGIRLLKRSTTGSFDLKAKVSGQADSAAVTLADGVQVARHDGAALTMPGAHVPTTLLYNFQTTLSSQVFKAMGVTLTGFTADDWYEHMIVSQDERIWRFRFQGNQLITKNTTDSINGSPRASRLHNANNVLRIAKTSSGELLLGNNAGLGGSLYHTLFKWV